VRQLLGRPGLLAVAAEGVLSREEQAALRRRPSRALGEELWTPADLPLIDEAQALLTGPPRRYGHVVLDEAQDLSPMALRMVARRSIDGRSLTVLGDLAQASAPGAVADWELAVSALGRPAGARIESLSVGYRVPDEIMEVANRYLAARAPGLPRTTSVRHGAGPPALRTVEGEAELAPAVAEEAAALLGRYHIVAVIAEPAVVQQLNDVLIARGLPAGRGSSALAPGHIVVLEAAEAKGLEFDAVLVVEPLRIEQLAGGSGLLYIALTRAVQHLAIVHAEPLPAPLRAA
jgi:DNA helicase IV